jgi:hypothetical protein
MLRLAKDPVDYGKSLPIVNAFENATIAFFSCVKAILKIAHKV